MSADTAAAILARPLPLPCGATLPNRLAKAAMSESLGTPAGDPSERLIRLYDTLGRGGAGMLLTGNVMVCPGGIAEPDNVIQRPALDKEPWRRWAAAAQAHGSAAWMQINHAGRQVPRLLNALPVAPSAVPMQMGGVFATPRALADDEITAIVADFAATAGLAKEVGFAGTQIHGAHGYLLAQFLSPLTNLRTDRWGGGLENRMRFALEVFRAMRAAVGPGFPVGIKLNSADFLRGGFSNEEALVVARTLSEEGIDLLEVSGGTYERPAMVSLPAHGEGKSAREAHFLEFARQVRPAVRCPVMLTGGIRTPATMTAIIEEGAADLIGLGRPVAVNPRIFAEILAGRTEPADGPRAGQGPVGAGADTAWHQQQLHRIADGLPPEADGSRWWALAKTTWANVRRGLTG